MSKYVRRPHIASDRKSAERVDGLFREAVGAFASLTRPSSHEISQVETLALALYPRTSPDARRYAAAVLSDKVRAPRGLLLRLALEPVAVSAPLLSRTPAFSSRDWLHVIKNTDIDHSRIIARRSDLPATVQIVLSHLEKKQGVPIDHPQTPIDKGPQSPSPQTLKHVNSQLQAMMAGNYSGEAISPLPLRDSPERRRVCREQLQATALTGDLELFATALADALSIDYAVAADIVEAEGTHQILVALRALDLSAAEAHLVVRAARPHSLATTASIRLFIERYESLSATLAEERVADWRHQSAAREASLHANAVERVRSNDDWDRRTPIDFEKLSAENDQFEAMQAVG